jgi:hypothetical protein
MSEPEPPFDDGEKRILRILIQQHRDRVIHDYREAKLDEELARIPTGGCDEYGSLDDD